MNSSKKEVDFIRGKGGQRDGSLKTIKEKKTSSADQLFEVRKRKNNFQIEDKPKKSKKKRLKESTEDNDIFEDNEKVVIESMSLSRILEGIIIYGCIQEISDFDLKLSVCGGIVATVSITNISNSYTRLLQSFARNESLVSSDIEVLKPNGMFKIGQYFPIKIISKSQKMKSFSNIDIKASMNPRDIYSNSMLSSLLNVPQMPIIAAVDSIEDHGFIMDIGFDDIKAFLPKKKAETAIKALKGSDSLYVGQLVLCAIESVNNRTVSLTTKYKYLSDFKLSSDKDVNLNCLIPGLTVSATVMNVSEKGLVVLVLNQFRGFVTRSHLRNDWDLPKNMYKIGDKIEGTILYRHPITKQISLSLKPKREIKSIKAFLQNVKIGKMYDNAVVMGRDAVGNFVFKLPDGIKGISHKKHLLDRDSDETDLDVKYPIGSKHRSRVKAINLMDMSVVLTLKQSSLDFPTVSIDDIQIGTIVRGKVKKLTKDGVVVQIGFGVRGFIPNLHLAETAQIKSREQLFPKEKTVKCRIFKMDKSCTPCKVSLTHKKSLMSKKLNILSSYESAKPGLETDAVVVLILKKGILVEFFNDIQGFIPIKYLSTYRIENLKSVFKLGQIVRCSVVSTDLQKEKITCSLIKIKDKNKSKENKNLIVGQLLKGMKISQKLENGFELIDEIKKLRVFLPFGHLSDDIEMCSVLSEALTVGDNIEEVMVFTIKSIITIVTKKKTFINSAKNNELIVNKDQLEPNLIVPVLINGFASYGIFVEMAANIKGLVPKRYLTDGPIDEPKNLGFSLQQTVFARFIEFEEQTSDDKTNKKLAFSLKLSHVWNKKQDPFSDRVFMFENWIQDMDLALHSFQKNFSDINHKLSNLQIGRIVFYRVIEVNDSQIICEVRLENDKKENSVKGLAISEESEQQPKVGSSGIGFIVNIDFVNKEVVIMIRPKLVKQVKNSLKINAISSVKCEQTLKCNAIYICDKYVLAVLSGHAPGLIAYIPSKRHLNDITGVSTLFSMSQTYHVVIKSVLMNSVIAVLKSQNDNKSIKHSTEIPENTSKTEDIAKEINKTKEKQMETNQKTIQNKTTEKSVEKNNESKELEKRIDIKDNEMNENSKAFRKHILKVNEPFIWSVDESTPDLNRLNSLSMESQMSSSSDESDSEDKTIVKKKTRTERNEENRLREESLRKREETLMDTERHPETLEDLERSVLASPNSSLVWLKYMAFHLEQTEISKARAVAERAIKTISFREERERLNVWVSYLNLENLYGTPHTLNEVFERALQYNEPVVIYRHLASIYSNSNKMEETESLFHTMTKKFKQNKNVWIDFGLFYMKNNRLESARKLLQRGLTCIEKREHIDLISKFAQMEFKWGEVEQAKTLFENLLANFPKRIDLWSVYIDMMLKYAINDNKEKEDSVRDIFERLITFKLSAKQMKFVFKRYIAFEKQFNNFERIERIKQKAMEYVEGKTIY